MSKLLVFLCVILSLVGCAARTTMTLTNPDRWSERIRLTERQCDSPPDKREWKVFYVDESNRVAGCYLNLASEERFLFWADKRFSLSQQPIMLSYTYKQLKDARDRSNAAYNAAILSMPPIQSSPQTNCTFIGNVMSCK